MPVPTVHNPTERTEQTVDVLVRTPGQTGRPVVGRLSLCSRKDKNLLCSDHSTGLHITQETGPESLPEEVGREVLYLQKHMAVVVSHLKHPHGPSAHGELLSTSLREKPAE